MFNIRAFWSHSAAASPAFDNFLDSTRRLVLIGFDWPLCDLHPSYFPFVVCFSLCFWFENCWLIRSLFELVGSVMMFAFNWSAFALQFLRFSLTETSLLSLSRYLDTFQWSLDTLQDAGLNGGWNGGKDRPVEPARVPNFGALCGLHLKHGLLSVSVDLKFGVQLVPPSDLSPNSERLLPFKFFSKIDTNFPRNFLINSFLFLFFFYFNFLKILKEFKKSDAPQSPLENELIRIANLTRVQTNLKINFHSQTSGKSE